MEIIGLTFEAVGTILIAVMALRVHHHMIKEHKIDAAVFRQMSYEQRVGMTGIFLVVVGFILQVLSQLPL